MGSQKGSLQNRDLPPRRDPVTARNVLEFRLERGVESGAHRRRNIERVAIETKGEKKNGEGHPSITRTVICARKQTYNTYVYISEHRHRECATAKRQSIKGSEVRMAGKRRRSAGGRDPNLTPDKGARAPFEDATRTVDVVVVGRAASRRRPQVWGIMIFSVTSRALCVGLFSKRNPSFTRIPSPLRKACIRCMLSLGFVHRKALEAVRLRLCTSKYNV